jgi:ABC-type amino acid transport substrate-binding protein
MIKKMVLAFTVLHILSCTALGIELKTAAQDSSPKFILADGKVEGICVDAMRAIEAVEPDIRFTGYQKFVPFRRIEQYIEEGKIDCFVGFVKNEKRMKKYIYVDVPIYFVRDILVARKDDSVQLTGLEDIKKLEDNTILASMGIAQAQKLKAEGYNVDDGGKTPEVNLYKLVAGRGRFLFQSEVSIRQAIKDGGYTDKVRILPLKLNETGRYIAFSKKTGKPVIEKVADALRKLRDNGELDKIYKKYVE